MLIMKMLETKSQELRTKRRLHFNELLTLKDMTGNTKEFSLL